ncbi:hypothetical protein [Pontimicrobium sp. MEBiC06410]
MDLKEQLQVYKQRIEELKPIISKGFKTDEELDLYVNENNLLFDEYYDLHEQIKTIEWDLMTPEEQSKKEEQRRLSKLKREGKL